MSEIAHPIPPSPGRTAAAARAGIFPKSDAVSSGLSLLAMAGFGWVFSEPLAKAAEALLDETERGGYDLLVVGRTGAGSPGSKMMGGVSRKLAEGAACSVLTVR